MFFRMNRVIRMHADMVPAGGLGCIERLVSRVEQGLAGGHASC
jgi:hypothetical protein